MICSKSTFLNKTRLSTFCKIEFFFATAIALFDLSIPIPLALTNSFNKDIKIQPEPVPKSKILKNLFLLFKLDNIK